MTVASKSFKILIPYPIILCDRLILQGLGSGGNEYLYLQHIIQLLSVLYTVPDRVWSMVNEETKLELKLGVGGEMGCIIVSS